MSEKEKKREVNKYIRLNKLKGITNINMYILKSNIVAKGNFYEIRLNENINIIANDCAIKNILYEIKWSDDYNIIDKYILIINELKKIRPQTRLKDLIFKGTEEVLLNIVKQHIDEKYIQNLVQVKKVPVNKELTNKTYKSCMDTLKKEYDIDNITCDMLDSVYNMEKSISTKKKYFCAINDYFKENDKIDKKIKSKVTEYIKIVNIETRKIESSNEKSESQKKNYISWNTVLEIRNRLKVFSEKDNRVLYYYLILGLYTYIPPRRTRDYGLLYYKNNFELVDEDQILWVDSSKISDYIKTSETMGEEKNYFGKVNDKYFLQLNNYKRCDTFKRHIIEISGELLNIFLKYIELYKLKEGDKIFNFEPDAMTVKLKRIFNIYVDKDISANLLRHIYISDYYINRLSTEGFRERKIIALKMAHSEQLNMDYFKKDDTNIMNKVQKINEDDSKLIDLDKRSTAEEKRKKLILRVQKCQKKKKDLLSNV